MVSKRSNKGSLPSDRFERSMHGSFPLRVYVLQGSFRISFHVKSIQQWILSKDPTKIGCVICYDTVDYSFVLWQNMNHSFLQFESRSLLIQYVLQFYVYVCKYREMTGDDHFNPAIRTTVVPAKSMPSYALVLWSSSRWLLLVYVVFVDVGMPVP